MHGQVQRWNLVAGFPAFLPSPSILYIFWITLKNISPYGHEEMHGIGVYQKLGCPSSPLVSLFFSSLNDQELGYTSNNWMIIWFLQFGYTTWNQQKCGHDSTKELQKSQTSSAPSSPDHLVGSKVLPTAAQDVPPEPLVARCRKCDAKSAPSGRLRTPIPTCFGGHITMQGPSWLTYCWSIIIFSRWKWSLSPPMSPQFPQCSS